MEHGCTWRRLIVSIVLAYEKVVPAAMHHCGKCYNRFALNEVFLCAGVDLPVLQELQHSLARYAEQGATAALSAKVKSGRQRALFNQT